MDAERVWVYLYDWLSWQRNEGVEGQHEHRMCGLFIHLQNLACLCIADDDTQLQKSPRHHAKTFV